MQTRPGKTSFKDSLCLGAMVQGLWYMQVYNVLTCMCNAILINFNNFTNKIDLGTDLEVYALTRTDLFLRTSHLYFNLACTYAWVSDSGKIDWLFSCQI